MLCGLFGLLIGSSSLAANVPVLIVSATVPVVKVAPFVQEHEDPGAKATLAQVTAPGVRWQRHTADSFQFGITDSTWWVRVRLVNPDATHAYSGIFDTGDSLQDYVEVYLLDETGRPVQHWQGGDRRPFSVRPVAGTSFAIPVSIPPKQHIDLYLRLATYDGLHEAMSPALKSHSAYLQTLQVQTMVNGVYFGIIAALVLYNAFLFASTRQRTIFYYVVYTSTFLLWIVTFRGYGLQYLWPDSPAFNNQFLAGAAVMAHVGAAFFLMAYLGDDKRMYFNVRAVIRGVVAALTIPLGSAVLGYYKASFLLMIPFSVIMVVTIVGSTIVLSLRGSRNARYILISFAALGLGVVLYFLRVVNVLPSNVLTENFLQIGSTMEVLLLAFGLADQINTLQADKELAQREAIESQRVLNQELDSLVRSRTTELENANAKLQSQAITDELTGAFNRRYFNEMVDIELKRFERNNAMFILCLFDIDNFKRYNDLYGHHAGDVALKQVAAQVSGTLKRAGDQLFRVGGEEFCILLESGHTAEGALQFTQEIRMGIEQLGIAHTGNPHAVVTASFGLLIVTARGHHRQDGCDEALYRMADALLYQAKAQGRNCVVSQTI